MGSHPVNLGVRFLLELVVLISLGIWGWKLGDGWVRFLYTIVFPLLAAVLWGVFAVPDDPSRSGNAPIPVPGLVRLILELMLFSAGAWAIYHLGYPKFALIFIIITIIHYLLSYDRIIWLINR